MSELKDKIIVVTGASGGMGVEVCTRLAQQGAKLALCSNDREGLTKLTDTLEASGTQVIAKVVDVTDEKEVEAFFKEVGAKFGRGDALLNLAGLSIPAKVWEMAVDKYDFTMDVNVKGTFLCSKHFIPLTDGEKGARIINIGSMAAKRANGSAPLYCTAKAAVNIFSQGLAIQVKEKNIRVTTLNPGPTDTAFWGDRPVAREKFMQASDVAGVIEFVLAADDRVVFHEIAFESFINFN